MMVWYQQEEGSRSQSSICWPQKAGPFKLQVIHEKSVRGCSELRAGFKVWLEGSPIPHDAKHKGRQDIGLN